MHTGYLKRHRETYCNVQTAHEVPCRADVGAVTMVDARWNIVSLNRLAKTPLNMDPEVQIKALWIVPEGNVG